MGREYLGELEQQVLLAALRLGDEAYSMSIIDELDRRTGRRPSHGAVYVALQRLERKHLVRSTLADPGPGGGRPPRLIQVEAEAVERLRRARTSMLNLWDGIEEVSE